MTAPIRPLLLAAALWALATLAAKAGAHHSYAIDLAWEPETGTITGAVTIEEPQGDVSLPDEDWLNPESLQLGGTRVALPDTRTIPAAVIAGRSLTLSFRGTLPDLDGTPRAIGTDPAGSFLIGAAWLPLDDRARHRFRISLDVPATHRAVATGSRIAQTQAEGRIVSRFVFDGLPQDLGLFAGPYTVAQRKAGELILRTYFETAQADLSQSYMDAAGRYVARYAQQISPYPYDSFSVVSAPIPVGLGFAGLTYVSRAILGHPYMRGRSLAHEVLHSWWGNAVGVDYDSGNWAEGLTTYQADHALAQDAGNGAARQMRLDWLEALAHLPAQADKPLRAFRSSAHDGQQAVGYGKAALVFHMLRAEIGGAAFSDAIRRFYATHRGGIAAWPDLQAAFTDAAGRDLSWFFDQWLDRAGLPRLSLAEAARTGDRALRVTIRQSAPAWRLTVPLRVNTAQGPETHEITLDRPATTATITTRAAPLSVSLDPGFDLARQLLPGETAPGFADLFRAEDAAHWVAPGPDDMQAAADRLLGRLFGAAGLPASKRDTLEDRAALVVIGDTGAVAGMRDKLIADPRPWPADTGTARAWIERRKSGDVVLFISADTAEGLDGPLAQLRYFGPRSYVAFRDGEQIEAGTWAVTDSPMVRALD